MNNVLEIPSSIGTIRVRETMYGKDYPGVWIDLVRNEMEFPVALVEVTEADEYIHEEATLHVYLNVNQYKEGRTIADTICPTKISFDSFFQSISVTKTELEEIDKEFDR